MRIKIEHLANTALLAKAWQSVRRKKSKEVAKFSRGIDNVTLLDFEKDKRGNLESLQKCLASGKYVPQPVKINLEKKSNGKYRMIAIPTIEDRIVQRAILNLFEPYILPIINNGVSYCGVRDQEDEPVNVKNAIEKLIEHVEQGYFWVFESDIVSFYDEIPKEDILNKLNSVVPMGKSIRELLRKYVYYKIGNPKVFEGKDNIKIPTQTKGITQGSALSPIFANLYLSDFDCVLKSIFDDRFIRYVDDFIIMCKTEEEAKTAKKLSLQEISKAALLLSPDGPETKTHIKNLKASEKIDFLGISIHRRGLIPKGGLKEARKHMGKVISMKDSKNNKKQYKRVVVRNGKTLDISDQMEEKINSWGEHYRFYHVEDMYVALDDYIEGKMEKMRNIRPLKPLGNIILSPIKRVDEWQSFFNK